MRNKKVVIRNLKVKKAERPASKMRAVALEPLPALLCTFDK
jgi:hypothetical protein